MLARCNLVWLGASAALFGCGPSAPSADVASGADVPSAMDVAAPQDDGLPAVDSAVAPDTSVAPDVPATPEGGAAPTWTMVYELLFSRRCGTAGNCHNRTAMASGALAMPDPMTAYRSLVGRRAAGSRCGTSGMTLVVAGDATGSLLVRKLMPAPPCGGVMPERSPSLTTPQLDMLRAWINAGALDN